MAISYQQREASLFLAACAAVGCIGGFVIGGVRMWREARHGSD